MFRNKTAEKDIRDHLSKNGYYGRSAEFSEIELHAVQRPGWLQIIRFSVRAKTIRGDQWVTLFGVMKDDERFKLCNIQCFEISSQRAALMSQWSQGLTQPTYSTNRGQRFGRGRTLIELAIFFSIIAAGLALLSLLS